MKRFHSLLVILFYSVFSFAQSAPSVTTSQLVQPVFTLNPVPVSLSGQVVGQGGPQTYYYWTVTNYTLGATSPFGPVAVSQAPYTLSSGDYVQLFPAYIPGIVSVDILRTSTPQAPSGACNCAVATAVTSGSVNDQSNSLSSYTVNPINVNSFQTTLTNEVISAGVTHRRFRFARGFEEATC